MIYRRQMTVVSDQAEPGDESSSSHGRFGL